MIFALLTLLSALSLASVAGWFSIIGITAIYAGAPTHALIMGAVLEGGKLVTTSWLYRNWNFIDWRLKTPLITFTIIIMIATSIGVFGFLSKAHLEQGAGTVDNSAKIVRLDEQIAREKSTITDDEKVIGQLDATINSYIGKDRADRSVFIRKKQDPERNHLRNDIEGAQKRIDGFSDEKFKLSSEVRKLQLDVGPIRYIAELIYGTEGDADKNIESAVRMFTLIIVSTLDPLAVILLIAANHTILRRQNEKKEKSDEEDRRHNPNIDIERNQENATDITVPEIKEEQHVPDSVPEQIEISLDDSLSTEPVEILDEKENSLVQTDKEPDFYRKGILENSGITEAMEETDGRTQQTEFLRHDQVTWPPLSSTQPSSLKEYIQRVHEEENTNLEMPESEESNLRLPSPIIRNPLPSLVSRWQGEATSDIEVAADEKVSKPISIEIKPPIKSNLHPELVGYIAGHISPPHFIPQRLNEEEEIKKENQDYTYDSKSTTSPPSPASEEIYSARQAEDSETESIQSPIYQSKNETTRSPKTLSWLNEFKGMNNG